MRWLAALLLAVSSAVSAAPSCWPSFVSPISIYTKDAPGTVKVGEVIYAASSLGLVFGYTCYRPDGVPVKVVAGGPWTSFPSDWLRVLDEATRGSEADRRALWDKYATGAIDARLASDVAAVAAQLPTLPIVVWRVAPNSAYTTRPTYAFVNGVRSTVAAAERVAVGAECNAAVGVVTTSTSGSYLGVLGRSDRVALCRKQ